MHSSLANFEERFRGLLSVRFEPVLFVEARSNRAGLHHNWYILKSCLLDPPVKKLCSWTSSLEFWININAVKLPEFGQSCVRGNRWLVYDVLDSCYLSLIKDRVIYRCMAPIFEIYLVYQCDSRLRIIKFYTTFSK
jgi:hypothetical protein